MPAPITRNHTCNLYCTGDRHCTEVLAIPSYTAGDVLQGANRYHRPHGWLAVEARPAPEADVDAWRTWMQQEGWGGGTHGHVQRGQVPEGEVVGWLVFIEPMDEDPHA